MHLIKKSPLEGIRLDCWSFMSNLVKMGVGTDWDGQFFSYGAWSVCMCVHVPVGWLNEWMSRGLVDR